MSEQRTPRKNTTREETSRKLEWRPQGSLPVPQPQDGWVFRWIRISSFGEIDERNVSRRFHEHWVPVKRSDHPEMNAYREYDFLNKGGKEETEHFEIGGLLLCKCPEEVVQQRRDYFSGKSRDVVEAVDNNFMKVEDSRMPLFNERSSKTTWGSGEPE